MKQDVFDIEQSPLGDLFSSDIVHYAECMISEAPEKGLPEEEACLEGVSASRKREFRAGRLCARNALRLLGAECVPIIPSEQRGPTWPEGVIGSISHTREYCAAVVGRSSDVYSLGLDVERSDRLKPRLWRLVLRDAEREWVSHFSEQDQVHWATLIFSAKEAFYKYQFPYTSTWVSFKQAEVSVDPQAGLFELRIVDDFSSLFPKDTVLIGRFAFAGPYVFTGLAAQL
ncbi:MAG TPA: phosphopantetheinyl transferase [Opitutae bacterium]|nr:phosphopantetheinyl transferase [Opitutae bacterium]|tara:strand:+ start:4238 stop:4924 length:687 start_codon:yes stop_codon:yes gene_type:complete